MMARYTLIALLALSLSASGAGLVPNDFPNKLSTQHSSFDDSTQLQLGPGWVYKKKGVFSGADVKLGLLWSSSMSGEHVYVVAGVTQEIVNLHTLHIRVGDGTIHRFQPANTFTEFDSDVAMNVVYTESTQRYRVPAALMRQMVEDDDVRIRLDVGQSGFYEGNFSLDKKTAAIRGFRKFIKEFDRYRE